MSNEIRRIERSLRGARKTLERQKEKVKDLEKQLENAKKKEGNRGLQVQRRVLYTEEEDRRMWIFLKKEVEDEKENRRNRCGILNPNGLATWRDYLKDTKSKHSAQSINSHFRRFLRPNLRKAPLSSHDKFMILIYFDWKL